MENTNELSIKVQATCNEAIKSLDKLVNAMTGVEGAFKNLTKVAQKNIIATEMRQVGNELDKVSTKSDKTFSALKKLFTLAGAKKIVNIALDWTEKSMDYSEALNLFNVILDDSTAKATKFQNVMNEAFGTNMTDTLTRQGLFQSMAENMGIASDYAYIMSENTTKLVNDISSLYNKKESTVSEALRAGIYAGQTKPLRSFGMDITEKTLQPELERLGIDRTVRDLNQAEKQLLRYISVLRQSQDAHGDWANTIEAPANQLKIFSNQLAEAQRALSNLFIGAFSKILPYANAILMVVEEVANAIATMFGIEIGDYNSSIASAEDAYAGLGESIDEDIEKANKLTKQMLSFDQTHNINENNNSANGDVSNGIDQRLLDAITGYDNGMEKVQMKAVKIRDSIMDWLGFTKEIDPLTGDVSFKLQQGYSNLKLIGGVIATIMGYKLVKFVGGLITGSNKLMKLLGMSGLTKTLSKLTTGVKLGVEQFKLYTAGGMGVGKALAKTGTEMLGLMSTTAKLGIGISGLAVSLWGAYDSFSGVTEETYNATNAFGQFGLSVAGAVASGATFGGVAGAIVGGVLALTTALVGYNTAIREMEVHKAIFDGQGISLRVLSNEMSNLFDNSTKYTSAIESLSHKYIEAQSRVDSARQTLKEFKDTLDLQNDAITESQISQLNTYYDNLKEEVKLCNQASENYYIALIKNNANAMASSKESTASQIADYKLLASTKAGYDEKYIESEKNLTVAYYTGKISAEEYNTALTDLKIQYGLIADTSIDATGAVEGFGKTLKDIDYGSAKEANEIISSTTEEYNKTIEALENYKETLKTTNEENNADMKLQIENLETTRRLQGELTEEQQATYDLLKATIEENDRVTEESIKNVDNSIRQIQGEYKGYLTAIYTDLVANGAHTTKEFSGTVKTIKDELKGLTDIDMSGTGKTIFDNMVNDIIANKPDALLRLSKEFKSLGIDGGDAFTQAVMDSINSKEGLMKEFAGNTAGYTIDGYTGKILEDESQNRLKYAGESIGKASDQGTRNSLGIKSPSKVYREIGQFVIDGYIEGIKSKETTVLDEIEKFLKKIEDKFNSIKFNISISNNIEGSFNSILNKLETFTNKFRTGINNMLYGMTTSMNGIQVGKDNKLYYTSMPYISVPKFEDGGFPSMGQMFVARENGPELVGQIGHKTAVANNEQIVQAVSAGVYNAVASAMSQISNSTVVDLNIHTEEGIIVEKAVRGIEQHVAQTGELPFTVPI